MNSVNIAAAYTMKMIFGMNIFTHVTCTKKKSTFSRKYCKTTSAHYLTW